MNEHTAHGQSLSGHLDAERLSAFLSEHGVEHEVVTHRPTITAAESAQAVAVAGEAVAKTLVLYDHGALFLAAVPASERLDLHKLRELLGATRSLRLASEDQIAEHFPEFELGAVPPVGGGMFAERVIDRRLLDQPRVLCSSADHSHGVLLDPRQLALLADATVGDICAEE